MNKFANIYRLGVKELRILLRDPVLIVLIIWTFSGGIYSIATTASMELHNAPIAVVDEDQSQLSRRIINAFYGPYFKTSESIDRDGIDPGMDGGKYTFVVDIPPDFERDLLADRQPAIQVNVDATMVSQAFIGSSYIQNITSGEINEFVQGFRGESLLPIGLVVRTKFNPNRNSAWFGSVMEVINNITLLSIILTGAAVIREREHGTLEHLLVMPLTPFEIMMAKIWAMGLVVLTAAALSLHFMVQGVLGVPVAGSVGLFLFGAMLHLFSAAAMGIFMGTVSRSMPQLGLLMILVILPLQMLSGGITPHDSMPKVVQAIMALAPTTHFVSFAQAILYRGAGFDLVWPSFLAIIAIGSVFFMAALILFRRSINVTA
ncbi:ABC-type transport system, permease component [Desulforapulum autotrophicum HRM2]|uniref:ABC-type transport system, permease component n=2 Tax=Desulforapulum autotrophicum TaxID=2296 RepID=C0QIF4_DESAH|nr:ABC transporter permease [Desulforapulum autotrophicum]ACN17898.1 ABC-type transport system, permease component [Desulforapulum autotrophicum HRM2]